MNSVVLPFSQEVFFLHFLKDGSLSLRHELTPEDAPVPTLLGAVFSALSKKASVETWLFVFNSAGEAIGDVVL